jgi:hypothetical protein
MIVKDKFVLLKDIANVLDLSSTVIQANSVTDGVDRTTSIMKIMEKRMTHYSKKKVYKTINQKDSYNIVYIPKYPLHVSYNKPTKSIIINLASFGTREITPTNPNPRDLYGCLVYGVCFKELVTGGYKVPDRFSPILTTYLLSIFIRIFGKEYGLLGYYSTQIPKLKFVISCYINHAFFGVKGESNYKKSSVVSGYDYRDEIKRLNMYDLSDIDEFIRALSELSVLPGISKYNFTSKLLRMLTINFLPVVEDCARFMSVMTTSNVPGVTFIPSALYRYNETEFDKIIEISKLVFR